MKQLPANPWPATRACGLSLILGAAWSVHGQESLRSAIEGDRSYQSRSGGQFLPPDEAIRTGPVTYVMSLGYGLEWNDNIRYAEANRQSDLIHSPQANLRATWQATKESVLSVGLGVGYRLYTDHSEYNRLFLAPDSELAWDIPVKDWVFTFYDRFHYSQDVVSQAALSGTAEFPRLDNTIGLRARWMPDRYVVEAGYGHSIFYSDSTTYDYLNRATEQFFGRGGYRIAELTQLGVEVSGGLTSYDSNTRGDNQNVSVGPYVTWQITEATDISLHGGYVLYHFDATATSPKAREMSSWYVNAQIRNRLTDGISQGLSVSREVQQGLYQDSAYTETLSATYNVSWAFHRQGSLAANLIYERGSEPRTGLRLTEDYERYGFGANVQWRFTRHLSAGAGFRFYNKDSQLNTLDYRVNSVTANLRYQF